MAMRRESPNARVFTNPLEQPTLKDNLVGAPMSPNVSTAPNTVVEPHPYSDQALTERGNAIDFWNRGMLSEDEYLKLLELSRDPPDKVFPNGDKYNPNKW